MPINKKKAKLINLLPQDGFDASTFGRVIKWALSSFRVMVIFTELVVMSAFLSRFWLDSKNSDLNDEINIKKAQINAYSSIESQFRLLQTKLDVTDKLYSENNVTKLINEITAIMPQDVSLVSFSIGEEGLLLKANSLSEGSIVQFLVNLEKFNGVNDPTLAQVSSGVDNSLITTFTVNAKVNQSFGKEGK